MAMKLEQIAKAISEMKLVDYDEYLGYEEYKDTSGNTYLVNYKEDEIFTVLRISEEDEKFLVRNGVVVSDV